MNLENKANKTVLVCPLDWGLGHASRCIPLINKYIENNYRVIIAADKAPLSLLQQEFPHIQTIKFPGISIKYSRGKQMITKMLWAAPKILWGIYREHHQLRKIIKEYPVDLIVSDNRFGLWNKNIHSIFITHQLEIQVPEKIYFFKKIINRLNRYFIRKFDKCFVPDFAGKHNLAGELSHPAEKPENIQYIGILSRFNKISIEKIKHNYQILVILSGPEPQRSILKELLQKQILKSGIKTLFVLGTPEQTNKYTKKNIDFVQHLPSKQLASYIKTTPYVVSRAGYSSIMDYFSLKKSAILIPTPGQTEQEYLAKYLSYKNWFYAVSQQKFNLQEALHKFSTNKYKIPEDINSDIILKIE